MTFVPDNIEDQLLAAGKENCPYCAVSPENPCFVHRNTETLPLLTVAENARLEDQRLQDACDDIVTEIISACGKYDTATLTALVERERRHRDRPVSWFGEMVSTYLEVWRQ